MFGVFDCFCVGACEGGALCALPCAPYRASAARPVARPCRAYGCVGACGNGAFLHAPFPGAREKRAATGPLLVALSCALGGAPPPGGPTPLPGRMPWDGPDIGQLAGRNAQQTTRLPAHFCQRPGACVVRRAAPPPKMSYPDFARDGGRCRGWRSGGGALPQRPVAFPGSVALRSRGSGARRVSRQRGRLRLRSRGGAPSPQVSAAMPVSLARAPPDGDMLRGTCGRAGHVRARGGPTSTRIGRLGGVGGVGS